jgi:hypothetical protein
MYFFYLQNNLKYLQPYSELNPSPPSVGRPLPFALVNCQTVKKCASAFRNVLKGARTGSKGGVYGTIVGGVTGAVLDAPNTIGCVSGVLKYAKPVWEAAKKVGSAAVDFAKNVGSTVGRAVSSIGRGIRSVLDWFGRRRHLSAINGGVASGVSPRPRTYADAYVRFTTHRSLRQSAETDWALGDEWDEEDEDPEFLETLADLAGEVELTELGGHFLDSLLLVDESISTVVVPLTVQTCNGLRNITRFTDSGLNGDLEAFMALLPANVSAILPKLQQGVSVLQSWSSAAQERASLEMQVQMMNFEQNSLSCFTRGDCPTTSRAQLQQLKQLLLHRLEDQAFVLLDVLAAEVRQYEYWSLEESRYHTGFPIPRSAPTPLVSF